MALALVACANDDDARHLLAVVVDLSGPGSDGGREVRDGVRLALRAAQEAGRAPGVTLLVQDDRGDPARAARLARRVRELDEVVAVIGPSALATARAGFPEYARGGGLPVLVPALVAPDLQATAGDVFWMAPPARYLGETLAWFVVTELGLDRAASFFSAEPYGQALDTGFFNELERLGGTPLNRVPFDSSVTRLDVFLPGAVSAPAVLVAAHRDEAARVIGALRAGSVTGPVLAGEEPPREISSGPVYYPVLFDAERDAAAREFTMRFARAFGRQPSPVAALAYDAAALVLESVAGGAGDRLALRRRLAMIDGSRPHGGVAGSFFFTRDRAAVRDVAIASHEAASPLVTRPATP